MCKEPQEDGEGGEKAAKMLSAYFAKMRRGGAAYRCIVKIVASTQTDKLAALFEETLRLFLEDLEAEWDRDGETRDAIY